MKDIPCLVEHIIQKLNIHGYDAYLVGGCVRDSLLGKTPKDWDITTSAKPQEVINLLKDSLVVKAVIPTGIEFGTVTVVGLANDSYEITTFRGDIYASDTGISHLPKHVEYVTSLHEDLARRDFTINAIAYDITYKAYIDPYNGIKDIKDKTIKCVGDPAQRFKEDPLRMLRAIRFASVLNFSMALSVKVNIMANAKLIRHISTERIREEFNKILLTDIGNVFYGNCSKATSAIMKLIIPEFMDLNNVEQNNPYHCYNVYRHSIEATRIIEPQLHLRLAALFHDLGKAITKTTDEKGIDHFSGHAKESAKIAEEIMKRLKYDNKTIKNVTALIHHHDRRIELKNTAIKRAMNDIGEDMFFDFCLLRYADITAQSLQYSKARIKKIFEIENRAHEILDSKQPFQLKDLVVNGNDLIALGFKPGPHLGQVLNVLLNHVIEDADLNDKGFLLKVASSYLI